MQQYVLDYVEPYSFTQLSISITNLVKPTSVAANAPFHITYTVTNNTGAAQTVYGELINNATGQPITYLNSEWEQVILNQGSVNVDYNFTAGIPAALNATLNVGHLEYAVTVQANNGSVTISPTAASYYPGQTVTLDAYPASGYRFVNWTGGVTGVNPHIQFIMGISNFSATANFALLATPTCSAGGPYAAQVYQQIQFNGTASGGTAPYSYVWDFGDGQYAYIEDPTHTYATTGQKSISLNVTDANSQACSSNTTANISPVPVPITCSAGLDQTGIVNTPVTFTGSGSGGVGTLTFNWSFGDGMTGIGNPIPHTYTSTGTYTATVTVTDGTSTPCNDSAYAVISGAGCTTGETQCIDGIKWVCINGVWQQTTQLCCNLNEVKCQNEQVYICDNQNNWVPSGVICCVPGTDKCIEGKWNTCNPSGDDWIPSEYDCQANIPIEYIIIGGVAVVGGLIAIAAATGGLGGYAVGRRRR